jgi:hypothetical protein
MRTSATVCRRSSVFCTIYACMDRNGLSSPSASWDPMISNGDASYNCCRRYKVSQVIKQA